MVILYLPTLYWFIYCFYIFVISGFSVNFFSNDWNLFIASSLLKGSLGCFFHQSNSRLQSDYSVMKFSFLNYSRNNFLLELVILGGVEVMWSMSQHSAIVSIHLTRSRWIAYYRSCKFFLDQMTVLVWWLRSC